MGAELSVLSPELPLVHRYRVVCRASEKYAMVGHQSGRGRTESLRGGQRIDGATAAAV